MSPRRKFWNKTKKNDRMCWTDCWFVHCQFLVWIVSHLLLVPSWSIDPHRSLNLYGSLTCSKTVVNVAHEKWAACQCVSCKMGMFTRFKISLVGMLLHIVTPLADTTITGKEWQRISYRTIYQNWTKIMSCIRPENADTIWGSKCVQDYLPLP